MPNCMQIRGRQFDNCAFWRGLDFLQIWDLYCFWQLLLNRIIWHIRFVESTFEFIIPISSTRTRPEHVTDVKSVLQWQMRRQEHDCEIQSQERDGNTTTDHHLSSFLLTYGNNTGPKWQWSLKQTSSRSWMYETSLLSTQNQLGPILLP